MSFKTCIDDNLKCSRQISHTQDVENAGAFQRRLLVNKCVNHERFYGGKYSVEHDSSLNWKKYKKIDRISQVKAADENWRPALPLLESVPALRIRIKEREY